MRKSLCLPVILSAFIFCCCKKYEVRHSVQYFISGNGNMNVSYTDAVGELRYSDNVSSSWVYAFSSPGDKRVVELSVYSVEGGAVAGSILIDGQEAALNYSITGSVTMTATLP